MNYTTDHTIRILAVSPYRGFKDALKDIAKSHNDVEISFIEADLYHALAMVKESLAAGDYDLIISRGGTADLLKKSLSIPVFKVDITSADILHAVKLADELHEKLVIILGAGATTNYARLATQLLGTDIPILTYTNDEEADACVRKVSSDGYTVVVCDSLISQLVTRFGITPVLITSVREEIENEAQDAITYGRLLVKSRIQSLLLSELLEKYDPRYTVAVTEANETIFSTVPDELRTPENTVLFLEAVSRFRNTGTSEIHRQIGERQMKIRMKRSTRFENVTLCYISFSELPFSGQQNAIRTFADNAELSGSFTYNAKIAKLILDHSQISLDRYVTAAPVIILSDEGSFDDSAASLLFELSSFAHTSFTVIDFAQMKQSGINWLLTNPNSHLLTNGTTLYFKNLDRLPEASISEFLSFLRNGSISRQCKLIFSCEGADLPSVGREIAQLTGAVILKLPPLRECREILHSLALLCINNADQRYNRQVVGAAPEAIDRLMEYDWPGNFMQLRRIISKLVQSCTDAVLSEKSVCEAIKDEEALYQSSLAAAGQGDLSLNLNRPLAEIEQDIVRSVVRNLGSQKKASQVLGISKTTIWRMLKD